MKRKLLKFAAASAAICVACAAYAPFRMSAGAGRAGYTETIAAYDDHSAIIKEDGTLWTFGNNWRGQLGTGTAGGESAVPVQVTGLENVI